MKKYLIFAILLGAALLFLPHTVDKNAENPTAEFLGKISSFVSSVTDTIDIEKLSFGNSGKEATTASVYKYQDKEGQWHFSDQSDNHQQGQSVESYNLNSNVISAIKPQPANTPSPDAKSTESTKDTERENTPKNSVQTPSVSPLTVFSEPEKVINLIGDAKSLQQTINNRKSSMDKQIDGL